MKLIKELLSDYSQKGNRTILEDGHSSLYSAKAYIVFPFNYSADYHSEKFSSGNDDEDDEVMYDEEAPEDVEGTASFYIPCVDIQSARKAAAAFKSRKISDEIDAAFSEAGGNDSGGLNYEMYKRISYANDCDMSFSASTIKCKAVTSIAKPGDSMDQSSLITELFMNICGYDDNEGGKEFLEVLTKNGVDLSWFVK